MSPDNQSEENPFQTPVSMLLYRLARNILESGDRGHEEGTVRELLTHCVSLLVLDLKLVPETLYLTKFSQKYVTSKLLLCVKQLINLSTK